MFVGIVWVAFCFLAAWIASEKGRSGVAFFFASLFFSPLFGIIAAFAARPALPPQHRDDYVMPSMTGRRSVTETFGDLT